MFIFDLTWLKQLDPHYERLLALQNVCSKQAGELQRRCLHSSFSTLGHLEVPNSVLMPLSAHLPLNFGAKLCINCARKGLGWGCEGESTGRGMKEIPNWKRFDGGFPSSAEV